MAIQYEINASEEQSSSFEINAHRKVMTQTSWLEKKADTSAELSGRIGKVVASD